MVKENICPLLTTNTVVSEDCKVKIGTQPVFCVKEQCAWWNENKQNCTILVLSTKL